MTVSERGKSRLEVIAYFGALSLFFSTIEYLIPKPIPFFRIGLANLPTLLLLPLCTGREIILLTTLKVLGQAIVNGTLASYVFLFSFGGSIASALAMWLTYKILRDRVSFLGISVLGALASNWVQIWLSLTFIFGTQAWIIAPLFMGLGLGAGIAVGVFALAFSRRSAWYASLHEHGLDAGLPASGEASPFQVDTAPRKRKWRAPPSWDIGAKFFGPQLLFVLGILILPAFLASRSLGVRGAEIVVLLCATILAGKRIQPWYFVVMVASITFFNLFSPAGRLLVQIGSIQITEGALISGLEKGLAVVGLVFLSLATTRAGLVLPGKLGKVMSGMLGSYEKLLARRGSMKLQGFFSRIDAILLEAQVPSVVEARPSVRTWRPLVVVVGLVIVALFWTPVILGW